MNRENRAKQFMPFDALKGLQEELAKREELHTRVEKSLLSEDIIKEISDVLIKLEIGSKVRIVFYRNGRYYELKGEILKINPTYKFLTTVSKKIYFDDIKEIEILEL